MTLPNFIIIGAGRSGTTSLYHYLTQHHDVFMSPIKETMFFAWRAEWAGQSEVDERALRYPYPVRALDDYETLFADAAGRRAIGEATPRYFFIPGVPEAIASVVPEARLIAILRDPAERAFSSWMGHVLDRRERRSFEQVIEDELPLIDRAVAPGEMAYLRPGLYHRHLMRFLARVPRDRLLVLLYADLDVSAAATMREVLRFLGVDERVPIDTSVRYNPTGVPRSAAIERLTAKTPLTLGLKRRLPRAFGDPLHKFALHLHGRNRRRRSMAPALRQRLLEAFRADTLALADFLDRDLSAWRDPEPPQVRALAKSLSR